MNTIIGMIVEAGRDEEGNVRLTIHTEAEELRKLKDLPLYTACKINIERCEEPRQLC